MKNKKGFTLVELLAVIAILSILVLMVMPNVLDMFVGARKSSFTTEVVSILDQAKLQFTLDNDGVNYTSIVYSNFKDGKELNLKDNNKKYYIEMDRAGNVKQIFVYDDNYCYDSGYRDSVVSSSILEDDVMDDACGANPEDLLLSPEERNEKHQAELAKVEYDKGNYLKSSPFSSIDKNSIEYIYVLDNIPDISSYTSYDVSYGNNKSVMAWVDGNKLYIGQNGGVIANPNSDSLFGYFKKVKEIDVTYLNVSVVNNMGGMFYYLGSEVTDSVTIKGLSDWNTSNVESFSYMFYYLGYNSSKVRIGDLSKWNTSRVTNMNYMFAFAGENSDQFGIGNIGKWNVSKVTSMENMFYCAGRYVYNWYIGDLSNWNVSNVTNMNGLFALTAENSDTFDLGDLSNWDTSKVTTMALTFFDSGKKATNWYIGELTNWNTSNVTSMEWMFARTAEKVPTIKLNLSKWDMSKVKNVKMLFEDFGKEATSWTLGDISNWNLSSAEDFYDIFYGVGGSVEFINLDLSKWKTPKLKNLNRSFACIGHGGNGAKKIRIDISGWDTSNVENFEEAFYFIGLYDTESVELVLPNLNTSNATNIKDIFKNVAYYFKAKSTIYIPKVTNGVDENTETTIYGKGNSYTLESKNKFILVEK